MNRDTSFIFPTIQTLPEVLGKPCLQEDVLNQLYQDSAVYADFQKLSPQNRKALLEFCMGNRGLKVTFDPFSKHIFVPDLHPERQNQLLSAMYISKIPTKEEWLYVQNSRPIQ